MNDSKRIEWLELASIVILAIVLRLLAGRQALSEVGSYLSNYDAYYHMRRILYTVTHFPHTLWFDTYVEYPEGWLNNWPPLYDQISATISRVFGQHSQQGIETISIFIPILYGTLTVVVVYFMVREVLNRDAALLSAFLVSISIIQINFSMLGAVDHHILEVLLLMASLLFMMMAFSRRHNRYLFAGLSGLFLAGLAYAWAGAIIYFGIFIFYGAVQMTVDLRDRSSTRETAEILLTSLGITLILLLPYWNAIWLILAFSGLIVAILAILLMFVISSILIKGNFNWYYFPAILFIMLAISIIAIFANPDFKIGVINVRDGIYYIMGKGAFEISEAKPLLSYLKPSYLTFWNIIFSIAGIIALIWSLGKSNKQTNKGLILLLTWVVYALALTLFGQRRFLDLSSISFGILISILYFQLIGLVEKYMSRRKKAVPKAFIAGLLLILIAPTLGETVDAVQGMTFPIAGDWYEALNWLKSNSNSTSFYNDPKYVPEYSVMSNWDYGNWIVNIAERPVVASNFQAGIPASLGFFLSQDERIATYLLNSKRSKYVIIDYDMLYGKLPALLHVAGENLADYFSMTVRGSDVTFNHLPKLLNTTLARLYLFDGAGTEHFRLIYESDTLIGTSPPKSMVKIFEYVPGALIRINSGPDQRVGALVNMTSNQGRKFVYVNQPRTSGQFELRVPYSTERHYGTYALGPYLIFSGNEKGIRMQSINVSEQDVIEGRAINVTF